MRSLLVALLLASGCVRTVPGDGQLVVIRLSDDAAASTVDAVFQVEGGPPVSYTAPLSYLVYDAAHVWDGVGARIRVAPFLSPEEGKQAPAAVIVLDVQHGIGNTRGREDAWSDRVVVFVDEISAEGSDADTWITVIAHELGHALGLHHLGPGLGGIMNANAAHYFGLQAADVEEFCARWPMCKRPTWE